MLKFWNKKAAVSEEEVVQDSQSDQETASLTRLISYSVLLVFILFYLLGMYWSSEPDQFSVNDAGAYRTNGQDKQLIVGHTTVITTEKIANTLLNKPGGFLSNDVLPPSVFLDNIPNWEFGVLVQVRDMVSALRNHISRSQSQSLENSLLKEAEPLLNNDHTLWIWPAAESKYEKGIAQLAAYREELGKLDNPDAQFYARADNLRAWLTLVEKRLGGLSQRLSASVGQERINTDLSGDTAASQSTESASNLSVKTPWLEIDDTFYEARGACWALIHLLKAIEVDFAPVLEKKNAKASFAQIIRELESTQETVWSPIILNGDGFGFVANHSLVMASYISRANAGLIDLRELLSRG
ncbi:DUF2333 family protein [Aliikangiella coralliicola]|uniref:DUF2333 family protein n=1 Tax=Aliikangiella coralliicola TaxID=2592383 RepID=A0A545TW65_9GAMM|nr:DUF2333 family protein [Aliikangiella coralliicola]TQV81460.1 DUF2333 family protein [Aliikangiella coralliicola]